MNIKVKPMGAYQTNCYIVTTNAGDFIIDPGVGAMSWLMKNVKNPKAILNTHGHFDHVWSNKEAKEYFKIPIYVPKADAFMLENDPFGQGTPPSKPDYPVNGDKTIEIDGTKIEYIHYPGHTPGSSAIVIGDAFFSGDFIFQNSIGRVDFPYSNPTDMKKSIKKFLALKRDMVIYPGHGAKTTVKIEQGRVGVWLKYI